MKLLLALAAFASAWLPAWAQAAPTSAAGTVPATPGCPPLLDHVVPRLQDEAPQSLCQYAGQVVLVVNTASYCGFTSQYDGLEALHDRYGSRGLVILGFPSNDFQQEKSTNREIAAFCKNTYAIEFPMFARSAVRGRDALPLWRQLAEAGGAPKWNFYKYLIGRDGRFIASFNSLTAPQSPRMVTAIEKALAARAPGAPAGP